VTDTARVAAQLERRAMQYCGPRGIPLSVFLGRVVGPGDPQWLPEDVAAALKWQSEQDLLCPGCGQPRGESFDKSSRYTVVSHRCEACAALQQRTWMAEKNRSKTPQFGLYQSVLKVD
jgi:hypothetical protein